MKNIAPEQLALLSQLEEFRKRHESKSEPSDWAIRMCQAIVAHSLGFTDRNQWTDLLKNRVKLCSILNGRKAASANM